MAISYGDVLHQRLNAVRRLAELEPKLQAFGICRHGEGFGFRAVKKRQRSFLLSRPNPLDSFEGIPISYADAPEDARLLASPGGPQQGGRKVFCGDAIQNEGVAIRTGQGCIGTLGCFVYLTDRSLAILSCNHVIAGKNASSGDSIAQLTDLIATLMPFPQLLTSPPGVQYSVARINRIDAALAKLSPGIVCTQGFMSVQKPLIAKGAKPNDGEFVFKVGSATGYSEGKTTGLDMLVEDVPYDAEACWFDESIEVEGMNGMFAQPGDSGAAVLNGSGEILGLLYAGNGAQYWVCPIDVILNDLNCSLT